MPNPYDAPKRKKIDLGHITSDKITTGHITTERIINGRIATDLTPRRAPFATRAGAAVGIALATIVALLLVSIVLLLLASTVKVLADFVGII